ncbi:unnamed protein product [Leptosia nina]|uniref:Uncharacterized protein n=1 Tax=Leptosia nina TaxID=320188 RepID=A0AAV1J407_9NEOP
MPKEEGKKDSSDGEDIPSDFFDDFCKDDFMQVIDSWNTEDTNDTRERGRINKDAVNSVNDLRELIVKEESQERRRRDRSRHNEGEEKSLDDYIRPGSRRDPSKTLSAIKKDKEVKVKELLAKQLDATDDIRPPGTELDDYYDDSRHRVKKKLAEEVARKNMIEKDMESSPLRHTEETQRRRRDSPKYRRFSPLKRRRESPFRHRRDSPPRYHRGSPRRYSPQKRRGFLRGSPDNYVSRHRRPNYSHWSPKRSPRRHRISPDRRRESRSRSPYKRFRSRSRSLDRKKGHSSDKTYVSRTADVYSEEKKFLPPVNNEYVHPYSYPQAPSYPGYTAAYYPPSTPMSQLPQPVPAPSMVPAPSQVSPADSAMPASQSMDSALATPYDALAKLVADGKLSHEDYLKLAPNKGSTPNVDPKERVAVLSRCRIAMDHLSKLELPNRLLISNNYKGQEPKAIAPKFCSPLKRQTAVEFHFSKNSLPKVEQRNKQIIKSIISALSLDKIVSRTMKKVQKNMKDASVQTMTPICEVCDIRDSTKLQDASTSVDPDHFSMSVHTQVIEEDLYSSKSMFNPSGSSSSGAPMSIAHLTPAQLVSQLAARAKTLKQTDHSSHSGPGTNRSNYEYDYRRGNQYHNSNYDYRYQ